MTQYVYSALGASGFCDVQVCNLKLSYQNYSAPTMSQEIPVLLIYLATEQISIIIKVPFWKILVLIFFNPDLDVSRLTFPQERCGHIQP